MRIYNCETAIMQIYILKYLDFRIIALLTNPQANNIFNMQSFNCLETCEYFSSE